MSVKDVCSGCASWVEQGWSYCMHCGAARPVTRSSLTSASLYSNSGTTVASKEKRNLRRRRRPSEEVGRQLQQVRMLWKSVSIYFLSTAKPVDCLLHEPSLKVYLLPQYIHCCRSTIGI